MNKMNFSHLTTKIYLLTAFLVLGFLNINAQSLISRYQFASSSGTYTAITGGTVWQSGATLATNAVTNVTLPFTFNFNGTNYTAINISNNGFITFGATAPAASDYAALSASTSYSGAIVGYGLNLVNSPVGGTTPEIRYEQVGSEFIIQFQDLGRTGITGDRMNFQIRLTQTTNTIKIVYGTWAATSTTTISTNFGQTGLRGASNTDYSGRNVNATSPYNTWASSGGSTASLNTNTGTMRYNNAYLPVSGLTFTWSLNSSYSALPYTQNFETSPWGNRNSLQDAASTTSMSTFPQLGNPAWKRQDATTANSLWGSTSGALAALTGTQGTGVARFHSYNASTGAKGYMDFYLDFSTAGTKQLTFDYQNTSGTDALQVALSTDGGLTFSNVGSAYGVAASWTAQTVSSLSSSTSTTVVLRFIATSDFGFNDIGVDNVNVFVPVTPTISSFSPTPNLCLNGGQTVTVSGSNFTGTSAVTFNGVNATSFTVVNSTTITAVTPSSLTAGVITVTTAGGSATSGAYTIVSNPTVAVTPTSGSYCTPGGTQVGLTASNGSTYAWLPAAGLSATTGASVNATPSSSTTYTVTGTDANGCTNTATAVISVNPIPVLTSVTATPATICSGDNSNLSAIHQTVTTAAGMVYSASTSATFESITSPTTATIVSSGSADDGYITVTPGGFTFPFLSTSNTSFGVGTNGYIVFGSNSSSIPSSVTSLAGLNVVYGFGRDGNLNVTNGGSLTHGFDATNTKYVFEMVKYSGGSSGAESGTIYCSYQIVLWGNASSDPGRIEVVYGTSLGTPGSAGTIGIRDAANTFINGVNGSTSLTTTAAAWPSSGQKYTYSMPAAPTFSWSPATFLSATNISNPVATAVTSTTPYTVTATANGCSTTGTATVTVSAGAAITTDPSSTSACTNSNASFTVAATGPGLTYQWFVNDGSGFVAIAPGAPYSGETTTTLTITNPSVGLNTYQYHVEVSSTCGAAVTSQDATLTVNTPSTVSTTPSSGLICNPGGTAVSVTASGASTYAWSPATGLSATTGASVTANPTSSTTYTVTGTDGNGCTASTTVAISVGTTPAITSVTATPSSICSGQSSNLQVNLPAPSSYCSLAATSTSFEKISNVTLGSINNTTSTTTGYENYTAFSTSIVANVATAFSIGVSSAYASDDRVFINVDLNQNGSFTDAGELLYSGAVSTFCPTCAGTAATLTGTVTLPLTAINGSTRMRVTLQDYSSNSPQVNCGTFTFGQVEDYTLVVSGGSGSAYSYSWTDPTSATTSSVSVMPTTNSSYTVTVSSATGCTATSFVSVTVSPSSVPTSTGTYSATFNHVDGVTNLYTDPTCNIIANVQDAPLGNVLGSTSVSSDITLAILVANNNLGYVPRVYTIAPSSNGSATVTLYYTQADFNAYNSGNGTQLDIATGPADATGIGNIRLRVASGGNINTGTLTNYTPSVSWNATDSRWEVSATLTSLGMIYLYGEPTCATAITNIISSSITPTSVQLDWDNAGVSSYGIRIRVQGSPTWSSNTNSATNSKSFVGLTPGTNYEVQIRAICSSSPQSFGAYYQTSFTTQALACSVPSGFAQSAVTTTGATITWGSVAAANGYSIRFKPNSSAVWNNTSSATNSRSFVGLMPNTLYDVEVRTNCTNFASSYAAYQFTTSASTCTPVTNIVESAVTSTSATLNWDNVASATSYAIRFKPNNLSTWNNTSSATNTRNFVGLLPNTLYDVEIRSNCPGEASSYVLKQFTTAASSCIPVTNIVESAVTSNSATLNWDNVTSAISYAIRFKPNNLNTWNNTSSATNTRNFVGLLPNTLYDVEIRSNCPGEASSYVLKQFTTLGIASKVVPVHFTASIFNFNGAQLANGNHLTWTTLSEQQNAGFVIEHSRDGVVFNTLANVATQAINGESENTLEYSYTHTSPEASVNYYRLQAVSIEGLQSIHNQVVKLDNSLMHSVVVSPNPTRDVVKVSFTTTSTHQTTLKVLDMTGRVVHVIQATTQQGANTLEVNLSELSAGMYTVQVYTDDKLTHVSKVQKQD